MLVTNHQTVQCHIPEASCDVSGLKTKNWMHVHIIILAGT